ncbi:MAG: membrane protein [Lysobacteraceae bacterium]|nr:MAG: membrane protein [Xanthomonadaceae bacterium]
MKLIFGDLGKTLTMLVLVAFVSACATGSKTSDGTAEHSDPEEIARVMAAELAGQEGRTLESATLYVEAAELSQDPQVAARATEVAIYARDKGLSERAVNRWLQLRPDDLEAWKLAAGLAIDRGDAVSALEAIDVLFERRPDDDQVWRLTAQMLAGGARPDVAIDVINGLNNRWPLADDETRLRLSYLAARENDLDLALAVINSGGVASTMHNDSLEWRAQLHMSRGDLQAAADDFRLLLDNDAGENPELRLSYAAVLYQLGQTDAAREQLQQLPDTAPVLYSRGLYALEADDQAVAEQALADLLGGEDEDPDQRHFYSGQLAEMLEKLDIAQEQYRQVRSGNQYIPARLRLAVLADRAGDLDQALAILRQLQNGNEEDAVRAFVLEAEVLNRNQRLEDGLAVYNRGLRFLPNQIDLLYARALQYERLDQIDKTERDLRKIIQQQPDNANAINALGYTLADRTDRYQEALELIERALELSPNNAAIVDSMGWIKFRLGDLEAAEQWLRKALELQYDSEVAAHLGEVLWVSGDRPGARKVWDDALSRDPQAEAVMDTVRRLVGDE